MLEDMFKIMTNLPSDHALGQLEGCYLYFDTKKKKSGSEVAKREEMGRMHASMAADQNMHRMPHRLTK